MLPMIALRGLMTRGLMTRAGSRAGSRSGGGVLRWMVRELLQAATRDDAKDDLRREAQRIVSTFIRSMRVHVDTGPSMRFLNDLQHRKIPLITAMALTRTAKELQRILEAEVEKVFDRPVTFTKRAFAIKPATPASQTAVVFIKTKQARYLLPQVAGGSRQPKRSEQKFAQETGTEFFWVPGAGVRLNTHGNVTLAQVKKIAAQLHKAGGNVFFGEPGNGLPFGIWERMRVGRGAGSLRPLLIRVTQPNYRKRLDMHAIADRHAQSIFNREFSRAWAQIVK